MTIIDFSKKGNVVRFFLGNYDSEWGWTNPDYVNEDDKRPDWLEPSYDYGGDDWDDAPYEHNAEEVYDEFIYGYMDVAFDFDDLVLEPSDGEYNSSWSKDDMKNHKVPCIIVVPNELHKDSWKCAFGDWVGCDGVHKIYLGDDENKVNWISHHTYLI